MCKLLLAQYNASWYLWSFNIKDITVPVYITYSESVYLLVLDNSLVFISIL
jgi:hypothetical protein